MMKYSVRHFRIPPLICWTEKKTSGKTQAENTSFVFEYLATRPTLSGFTAWNSAGRLHKILLRLYNCERVGRVERLLDGKGGHQTRFLNFNQEFLLVEPILTLCCTYFWRTFVTCVAWISSRALCNCRFDLISSGLKSIFQFFLYLAGLYLAELWFITDPKVIMWPDAALHNLQPTRLYFVEISLALQPWLAFQTERNEYMW